MSIRNPSPSTNLRGYRQAVHLTGKHDTEGGAAAGNTPDPQVTTEQIADRAADREPQPGASKPAAGLRLELMKRFKDLFQFLRRDANAPIRQLDPYWNTNRRVDGRL